MCISMLVCLFKKSDVIGMSNIFPVPYVIYIPITCVSTLIFVVSSSVSVSLVNDLISLTSALLHKPTVILNIKLNSKESLT